MYKVMLADDEGLVLESLKMIIKKHFKDTCMIETAKTGRSVIELAECFRPDIAIMDIQMPGINGMDAIEEIKKFSNNTIFIVVSAFDKFDYAKRAIDLNVLEFVTKPFNAGKIVKVLEKAIQFIDEKKYKREMELKNREKLETVVPIIESSMIYTILFQEDYREITYNVKQLLDIKQDYGYMMIIECGEAIEQHSMTNPVGIAVRAQKFYQVLREIIKEFFECVVGPIMTNRIVVFVPCEVPEEEYSERIRNIEMTRDMIHKLKNRIDVVFRVGIGAVKPIEDILESYKEAIRALHESKRTVTHIKDLIGMKQETQAYPIEVEKSMLKNLKKHNTSAMVSEANVLCDWIMERYKNNEQQIKNKLLEIIIVAKREVMACDVGVNWENNMAWKENMEWKENTSSIKGEAEENQVRLLNVGQALRRDFVQMLSSLSEQMALQKEDECSQIIRDAKAYIENHVYKDISLDLVAKEVNISPYYFSKIFKEEIGENFIDYITNIRIERAKKLLRDKTLSIKEICMEVGYKDPNYFSRLFKKSVGFTPTEYREEA